MADRPSGGLRFAEHEGHRIDTAASGKEAVRLCGENDYDLIILDIQEETA